LKNPGFWKDKHNLYGVLLSPFSALYQFVTSQRERFTSSIKVNVPVICVGNIVLGGAGKTPVAIMIASALQEQGLNVHILSRGYGGKLKGPLLVDPFHHTAQKVGDEPLLLAKIAPTWVSKNKIEGAQAAIKAGAEIILLDDGLQNPTLYKDFSILIVNGEYGLGNERIFPAGPLRETAQSAFRKANIIIMMGKDRQFLEKKWRGNCPIFHGDLSPNMSDIQALKNKAIYAFAGIGHPEKFFTMLRNYGLHIIAEKAFPDHYPFKHKDLKELRTQANQFKAQLVTTEKDFLRLPQEEHQDIKIIRVHAVAREKNLILNLIHKVVSHEKMA
jgi:tetraacyldisaccharide 4'-kinase